MLLSRIVYSQFYLFYHEKFTNSTAPHAHHSSFFLQMFIKTEKEIADCSLSRGFSLLLQIKLRKSYLFVPYMQNTKTRTLIHDNQYLIDNMEQLDWGKLPFSYIRTDYNVRCWYRNGQWGEIETSSEDTINLSIAATCLHYGQEAFEGQKAFRCPDGKIRILADSI